MKLELTDRLIAKLKKDAPQPKEYEIRDTKVPGLVLRVKPSGNMVYTVVYARGKRVTIGSADTTELAYARSQAKKYDAEHDEAKLGKRIDPIDDLKRIKRDKASECAYLDFLRDVYRPHLKATLRKGRDNDESVNETMACLERAFMPEFKDVTLNKITSKHIDKWIERRSNEVKPASIKRQLNDLSACLNHAVSRKYLAVSPFADRETYEAEDEERVRYLSMDEESILRKCLDEIEGEIESGFRRANQWRADHLKPAVLISLNTGLRRGELLKLRWHRVNFERRILTVDAGTAKSAKTRRVPLNDEALAVLLEWQAHKKNIGLADSEYVFSNSEGKPFGDMRTAWEGLKERCMQAMNSEVPEAATIKDFRWHDLRHTFASKLAIAGVDIYRIKELLGHTDIKMTSRYAHLHPSHMQDAVNVLNKPVVIQGGKEENIRHLSLA